MNKIIKLSYFLFVSLAIVSCSKDDDQESFSNTVEYNGVVFDVKGAVVYDLGSDAGFYSKDFQLAGTTNDGKRFSFAVELISKGAESLKTGVFKFYDDESDAARPDLYISNGEFASNSDFGDIKSGNITLSKDGDNYGISGVVILDNNKEVKISYSGKFIEGTDF